MMSKLIRLNLEQCPDGADIFIRSLKRIFLEAGYDRVQVTIERDIRDTRIDALTIHDEKDGT